MPLSDHALLLVTARLGQTTVRCLSWNVMAHRVSSNDIGVDDARLDDLHQQQAYRYGQIARHLADQAATQGAGLIALQEVTHQAIRPHLESCFPSDQWWYLEPDPRPAVGVMSLVSKADFSVSDACYDPKFRTQSYSLQTRRSQLKIAVHNVWTPYSFLPRGHEYHYRSLLSNPGILIGDTNSRILPLTNCLGQTNRIATGVIPPVFKGCYKKSRKDDLVLDHSDGALMAREGRIFQLPYQQLTSEEELVGTFTPSPYHDEYFRPVLSLDPYYEQLRQQRPYREFFALIQGVNASQQGMGLEPVFTANPRGAIGVGLGFSADNRLYEDMNSATALKHPGIYDWGSQPTLDKERPMRFLTISPDAIPTVLRYLKVKFPKTKVSGMPASLFYPPRSRSQGDLQGLIQATNLAPK